jgi:hypothetical protein
MDTKRLETLITKLHEKTMTEEVYWEKTSKEGLFMATFPGYSVRIATRQNMSQPDEVDYIFAIYDEQGALIERIDDIELQAANKEFKAYKILAEIYDKARRKALGVDKAIEVIISELDKN